MSRYRIMVAVAAAAVAYCAAPLAITHAAQIRAGGAEWGRAIKVPGFGELNSGSVLLVSVSCGSAGNCAAGGSYQRRDGSHAFVASERHGRWGEAIEVPGMATLRTGGDASVNSMSCASAGNCTAGGFYAHRFGKANYIQAFVASERNGRWGRAIELPGSRALNVAGNAQVVSVSCASAGNCTVGGFYFDRSSQQPFVASERNGRWHTAIAVPGMATLTGGVFGFNQVYSVSCASAGNCTVGGSYRDSDTNVHAFVASQRNGSWGTAIEVPGMVTLNTAGFAEVNSVSCASAGNCVAGGFFGRHHGGRQAFVASQRNGRWGTAIEVPGTRTLNVGRDAQVVSVSCTSAGNCVAGGFYSDRSFNDEVFVVSQRDGRWGTAIEVPGMRTLNHGLAQLYGGVSCVPADNCVAGGIYTDRHGNSQGFVVSRS
jgi:hypothetical protein